MQPQTTDNRYCNQLGYQTAVGTAAVAGIFSLVIAVLLIAHYLQSCIVSPLEHPALLKLIEKSQQNPEDQNLRQQARALDLLARKAYFTTRMQIRVGSYLLLAGIGVTLLALKSIAALRRQSSMPTSDADATDVWNDSMQTRKAMVVCGITVALVALILGYLGHDALPGGHVPAPKTIATAKKAQPSRHQSRPSARFRSQNQLQFPPRLAPARQQRVPYLSLRPKKSPLTGLDFVALGARESPLPPSCRLTGTVNPARVFSGAPPSPDPASTRRLSGSNEYFSAPPMPKCAKSIALMPLAAKYDGSINCKNFRVRRLDHQQ